MYAFDKDSKPLGEINNNDYTLTWTAHVANKKSSWVRFRGRVAEEQMSEERKYILRNPDIQGWVSSSLVRFDWSFTHMLLLSPKAQKRITNLPTLATD